MTAELQKKLTARLVRNYHLSEPDAQVKARMLGQRCPAPLQKNLEQWASGQPLSEIRIGRYSIPMIMAIWGQPDFSGALDVLTEYLTGDRDAAERRIWQMRR